MNPVTLYLECHSGISGDMTVASLLDLGADRQVLMDALNSLPLTGYSIEIKDVFKSGIRACDFHVVLDAKHENHDHDMNYLHGTSHDHAHNHENHSHVHTHDHEDHSPVHTHNHEIHSHDHVHIHEESLQNHVHTHSHETALHEHKHPHASGIHVHHHHESRNLDDIIQLITAGRLTEHAKALAIRIFTILAEAEAQVHGKSIQEVHFHEVGAVDSIVDIVAAAVCIDNLNPSEIVVSTLTEGSGQIRCQHGLIPVPVPAVAAIAANQGLILKLTDIEGELVTPTGAAIAAAIRTSKKLPEKFTILRTGFGAGKREYKTTGILRAMLIQPANTEDHDTILALETNIDDCSGEALSYTMQQLMDHGALDVFYTPIYMKKNRPAYLLKVICMEEQRREMESIIFRNTTTIGIRIQKMQRTKLQRKILTLETPWGTADIKCCIHENETYYYPENDHVARLAQKHQIGFPEMYHLIQAHVKNANL